MPEDNHRRTLQLQKLGRFLSLLLKHRSVRFPIQLDVEGYASLTDVMYILKRLPNFRWASTVDIKAVLDLPGQQRFEMTEGRKKDMRIRALDSDAPSRPQYEPVAPPEMLYYGTSPEALNVIKKDGIQPQEGRYVHLAVEHAAARSIAVRITLDPIILHIDAATAHSAGQQFYTPSPGIYLTEAVSPQYIQEFKTG